MINDNNLLNQYKESKRIIGRAKEAHQLVLFVGAGASNASGMPIWRDAVNKIADCLSITVDQLDYLRIPQYYFNARGKKEYTQLMREIFRYGDYLVKHEIHDKIIELNTETIITTNYDHLIEQAAEDNSQILSVVSKDSDLPYRKGGKELIKMHGDFENDNFVLKEDDYLAYSRNFKLIENYVKSLIGTKVVLFIGYSFNDPDLKHIFSWVKDILGGDLQRAYLIESGKTYDVNEAEYFKNFGINPLYASIQFQEQYDSVDLEKNLLLMLNWLSDSDDPDKLTKLYNNLKPFISMNYASQKYVKSSLFNAGIYINNGILTIHDEIGYSDEETKLIFKSLAYEQWVRLGKIIDLPIELMTVNPNVDLDEETINRKKEENNKRAEEYFKNFETDKDKQEIIKQILDVICKSNAVCMEAHLPKGQSENGWQVITIPFSKESYPEWIEYVNTFNFDALEKKAKDNREHLSETRPELYMEQGYIQFVLGNKLAAYNCYKNAKSVYYKRREYVKFFIAEFNRFIIGKTIIQFDGLFRGIDSKEIAAIKEELEDISLDKMFNSLPDLGESNKALKDLYTFNIAYTLFQDAYNSFEKINEQARTKYYLFSGTAAFVGMRQSVFDYYQYLSLNYLSVNDYTEHVSIFRIYFQSIVNSVMVKDEVEDDGSNRTAESVHASEIQPFDLLVALKFVDLNNIEKIFKGISSEFPLSDNATNYMATVIENCNDKMPRTIYVYDNYFWKCIIILGHCNLNQTLVDITLRKLNVMTGFADYRTHANKIITFISNAHRQKMMSDDGVRELERFVTKEFEFLDKNKSEANLLRNLTISLLWVLKEHGQVYDKVDLIQPLIDDTSKIFAVSIYKFLGEECKKVIYDAYSNWSFEKGDLGFEFYYYLVNNGIIKPSADAESSIFEHYKNPVAEETGIENLGITLFPAQDEGAFLYQLLELYINGLILDKDSCIQLLYRSNIVEAKWVMNYRNFDYSSFDINWLNICTETLISDMCKDEEIKCKIKNCIEHKYQEGKVSQNILDLYFKYMV